MSTRLRSSLPVLSLVVLWSCIIVRGTTTVDVPLSRSDSSLTISTFVKAHLADGGTVLYRDGVQLVGGTFVGRGVRFGLTLEDSTTVDSLRLDDIVAMESFHTRVRPAETIGLSAVATFGAIGIGVAIACAVDPKCFGSCPTVYSDSAGTPVLEAEGFSYSIAPLFERRDVDRLRAQPDADGLLQLEIRNEALETHFINHLEVLELRHGRDEWVGPDPGQRPVALRNVRPPVRAADRRGRGILPEIQAHDGTFFRSDPRALESVSPGDLEDWIDLEVANPGGADSVALVFRMRNSLLATVLFYDLMLADRGTRAVDWMARDLSEIAPAMALGRWALEHLGMRVAVQDGDTLRPVARLGDSGPVAWKDVVAVIPTFGRAVVRVRLTFPADNWRIDRVGATPEWRRLSPRAVPIDAVTGADGRPDPAALTALAEADARYLETTAGDRLAVAFHVGRPADGDAARTFLLASQGYYLEWMRRDWLARGRDSTAFTPGPAALVEAMRRWRLTQDETERRFYLTRVPVR